MSHESDTRELDRQFGYAEPRGDKHSLPLTVKILRVNPLAKLPAYATEGSVGLDLQSMEDCVLYPAYAKKLPTGIALSLPRGYEAQIRPRSGLSAKGVHCAFGTVDSDFVGELCVVLTWFDFSREGAFKIEAGDRVAQLVVSPVPRIQWDEVSTQEELGTTTRGTKGFGSSGVK